METTASSEPLCAVEMRSGGCDELLWGCKFPCVCVPLKCTCFFSQNVGLSFLPPSLRPHRDLRVQMSCYTSQIQPLGPKVLPQASFLFWLHLCSLLLSVGLHSDKWLEQSHNFCLMIRIKQKSLHRASPAGSLLEYLIVRKLEAALNF